MILRANLYYRFRYQNIISISYRESKTHFYIIATRVFFFISRKHAGRYIWYRQVEKFAKNILAILWRVRGKLRERYLKGLPDLPSR